MACPHLTLQFFSLNPTTPISLCLGLLLSYNSKTESLWQTQYDPQNLKSSLYSPLPQKPATLELDPEVPVKGVLSYTSHQSHTETKFALVNEL